jgi:hypothetical protein
VSAAIVPRDAATLPRPPDPYSADGNAYAVTLQDAGHPIAVDLTGTLTLAVPHAATAVLFSADGASWTVLAATSPAPNQVQAAFARSGYYLAATDHALTSAAPASGGGTSRPVLATLVALPILALLGLVLLARRSARQRTTSTL